MIIYLFGLGKEVSNVPRLKDNWDGGAQRRAGTVTQGYGQAGWQPGGILAALSSVLEIPASSV